MPMTATQVQQLYVAYFNRPADYLGLQYWMTQSPSAAATAFAASSEYAATYAGMDTGARVNAIYQNLFGHAADLPGLAYWSGQVSAGRLTIADVVVAVSNGAQGTDLAAFNAKVSAASAFTTALDTTAEVTGYSGTGANNAAKAWLAGINSAAQATTATATAALNATVASVVAQGGTPGSTYALTTALDNLTGTSGNDTFNAVNTDTTAGNQTFTSGDVINGGAGVDTLNVQIGTAGTYGLADVSSVEVINANFKAAGTVSGLGNTSVTNVNSNGSTAAATFTNITSTAIGLGVYNTDQNATFGHVSTAVSGLADATTLTVSGVTAGTVTLPSIETLNIVSAGNSDNVLTALTAAAATTINVSGSAKIDFGNANTVATTVNASASTGGVTLNSNTATAATITGGSGNDSITMTGGSAVSEVVSLGAGNDTLVYSANLATTDTLNGGDGTDTLRSTSALLTGYIKPSTATITNFETLAVSDALGANLTAANVQVGINSVVLDAALAAARTITLEAGVKTVTQTATQAAALTVSDTGTATTDSLTLDIAATVGAVDVLSEELVVNGFETVNIITSTTAAATQAVGAVTVTPDATGAVSINFSGNNTVTTGVITASSAASGAVNASGLTGTATFTNVGATVGITSIVGSINADTLVGSATATTIDGGAGNDTITGGAGNDSLLGAAGNDSITAAAGNDFVDGGAGNDTIVFAGDLATGDIIVGGAGTDTIKLTNASLTTLNAYSVSAVNALNANISEVERVEITDSLNQGTFDFARLDGISYVTLSAAAGTINGDETLSGLASGGTVVLKVDPSADTDIMTLSLADNTGAADSFNLTLQQAATDDYGVVSIAGIETFNITANESTASATVRVATLGLTVSRTDGTNTRAVTVNISGTESVELDTAVGADVINASGLTDGALVMSDTTGSSLAQTITGGAVGDTIYGGGGADVIDGGAGGDSLFGGTGADVITGGLGADTITGGAGNDSIVLTEGTASVDDVVISHSEYGADLDTVTGFTTTSTGDEIQISLAALESATTTGIFTTATNFEELFDGDDVTAGAATVGVITGAATVANSVDVTVLRGATFASVSDVEDALESGGSFALTVDAAAANANNAFIVVYSDGTDAYVAAVHIVSETTNDTDFEAGDLDVINLVKLVGVSSIGATTFADANFEFIA